MRDLIAKQFLAVCLTLACSLLIPGQANAQLAFVAERGADAVAVVDPDALVVLARIPVGDRPTSLASTPDGQLLYVTNTGPAGDPGLDSISVISVAGWSVIDTVVASGPWGIAITPDGAFAYVSGVFDANVRVLRLSDHTFTHTLSSPFFDTPQGLAIRPQGDFAYVANVAFLESPGAPENITPIRISDNAVLPGIDVSAINRMFGPWDVTVLPDGLSAYSNDGDNGGNVYAIDTDPSSATFNQVTAQIPLPVGSYGPRGMASGNTPLGVRVFAAVMEVVSGVAVIDPQTNQITDYLPMIGSPWRVRLNPDGSRLWVSLRDGEVVVLDTTTYAEIGRIPGFNRPADIAFPGSDAAASIRALSGMIQGLVDGGTLTQQQAGPLLAKLDAALNALTLDKPGSARAAIHSVEDAFVNQVNALVNSGALTPAEAEPLLALATLIGDQLADG